METISTIATAVPPYLMTCAEVKRAVQQVFQFEPRRLAPVMALFDHAQVARRYSVFPLDELIRERSLTQTAREYQEHAIALGRKVAADCLAQAALRPNEIDLLITVSCTGYMIPSLDAYLINDLGFRANVRRLPITELGCAAGAVALARAREFVRAFPQSCVLVVAVELPSLTFQHDDPSQANLISCALFGDGAAALEQEFDLSRDAIRPSWDVLQDYGNLSSAAILFVLREWLTKRCPASGTYGLMAGFGPGFSAELLLLRWI